MSPAKPDRKWHHDWRLYLAFFGVTSFGGLVSQAQKVIGYLAAPAIEHADSSAQHNMRSMLREFADTVSARQAKGQQEVLDSLGAVKDVVSRMPGARRAAEELRRDRDRRRSIFGMADNSRSVWNDLKGQQ